MPRGKRASLPEFRHGLAARVQAIMTERGWTREQLAIASKVSVATVHYLLRGKHGLGAHIACDVAAALDVSLDWLLRGEEFTDAKSPLLTSPKSDGAEYNG